MTETRPGKSADEHSAAGEAGTPPTPEPAAEQEGTEHPEQAGSGGAGTRRRDSLREEIRAGWQRALGH